LAHVKKTGRDGGFLLTPTDNCSIVQAMAAEQNPTEDIPAFLPHSLSVNQVVAFNLRRARESRGWSQLEAAVHIKPYLNELWSRQRFSAAERVYTGETEREFSVNELVAFARGFDLSVVYFLTPPPGCLHVFTSRPSWFVTFDTGDDLLGMEVFGRDVDSALREEGSGWKVINSAGPLHTDAMWAPQLLQLIGNAEAPKVAERLRALADELERGQA
jgi:hypothetical protein